MRRKKGPQLALPGFEPPRKITPAARAPHLDALASTMPSNIRLGTSSWSFPGWAGLVYKEQSRSEVLAREGLHAYASHPLLQAVGLDRTYYQPLTSDIFANYRKDVGDNFRFLVKAHDHTTLGQFPQHARYGTLAGQPNPRFLDPEYATQFVVRPALEGLQHNLGVILFQFSPQAPRILGEPEAFAAQLHSFLQHLPKEATYAVELRTPALMTQSYAQALQNAGAMHCINVMGGVPLPNAQAQAMDVFTAPELFIRWMLAPGLRYAEAKARYHPFDRLVDPNPLARHAIAQLVCRAHASGKSATVIINNKAEGSSPLSVMALAEEILSQEREGANASESTAPLIE